MAYYTALRDANKKWIDSQTAGGPASEAKLRSRLAAIENEIENRRARMKEIGCSDADSKSSCPGTFAGPWKTGFGDMNITITNGRAEASYAFDSGSIKGNISGGGTVLDGTYIEGEARGTFHFVLSSDGSRFTGTWKRTSGKREPPSGTWDGRCMAENK